MDVNSFHEIFLWRYFSDHSIPFGPENPKNDKWMNNIHSYDLTFSRQEFCEYCANNLFARNDISGDNSMIASHGIIYYACKFCGWGKTLTFLTVDEETTTSTSKRILKQYTDINSEEILLGEVGKYLLKNSKAMYDVSPRRFEQLVEDVFRSYGYYTVLTKQTRDGGKDIVMYDKDGEKYLVEVKRYRNTIGVDFIRKIIGVQVLEDTKKAKFITSSTFTNEAVKASVNSNLMKLEFELELIDAEELLNLMNIYNSIDSLVEFSKIKKDYQNFLKNYIK